MSDLAAPARPAPRPTPETAEFWAGTAAGVLRYQRCGACDRAYLPPQPWCPACGSDAVRSEAAAGTGTVLSAVVSHLPAPGFPVPSVLAVVALDEGPQLLSNLVDVDAVLAAVPPGLRVTVAFQAAGDHQVPVFRPVDRPEGEA